MDWIPNTRDTKKKDTKLVYGKARLRELNLPRSSCASTERPFVKFANPIPNDKPFGDGLDPSYEGHKKRKTPIWCLSFFGDPYGNRTHVTAVKGPCLNRLTNGPNGSGNWT